MSALVPAAEAARGALVADVTAYADGRVAPGWLSIVPPLVYVAAFFTYFPTFTPITAMVRNAVGALSPLESVVCIVEVFAVAGVLLWFAQYLFRHSVAQYGSKVTVRQVLSWRRKRS